MQQYLNIT